MPGLHVQYNAQRYMGKVAALLLCSFAEVLVVDADCMPLIKPQVRRFMCFDYSAASKARQLA